MTRPGAGLVIDSLNGATHVLGADGREVSIAGFGSVNANTSGIPVKGVDDDGNLIFVNSIITEVFEGATPPASNYDGTGGDNADTSTNSNATGVNIAGNLTVANNLTVTQNATITGNLTVQGDTVFHTSTVSQYEDQFIELNVSQDKTAASTSGIGGILIEHTHDAGGGNELFGGLRFNGAHNSNVGRWEYNLAAEMDGSASVNTSTGAVGEWIAFPMGTLTGIGNGNGITVSTTAVEDGVTGTEAAPLVSLNLTGSHATETTASRGGLAFTNVGTTAGDTSVGIAQGGVDATMMNVTTAPTSSEDNYLLSYNHASTNFTWVAPGGTGSINRAIITGTKAAADTVVTISPEDVAGTGVGQTATGIGVGEQNLTVTVYEMLTGGFSQILPESIVISSASGTEGQVTVTFGATGTTDVPYKIVILG